MTDFEEEERMASVDFGEPLGSSGFSGQVLCVLRDYSTINGDGKSRLIFISKKM